MKVLSVIEPYATLICEKKKYIETRSWKTNYRGELYIHASVTKIPENWANNDNVMNYVENKNFNFGKIICKCNLVDCVYIDENLSKHLETNNNQEFILGNYDVGRYAWVLSDIEVLNNPIVANGQLNIWNYYNPEEIMELMDEIDYGWIDANKEKHYMVDNSFCDNFIFQSPKECIDNKIGICWEQVELERYYFKGNKLNIKTFFIVHYDGLNDPSHTFLTYEMNNMFYWFEHSWNIYKGIHEYDDMNALLQDVRKKFINNTLNGVYDSNNLVLYEYIKPKSHLKTTEFYKHCSNGKMIILNNN